MAPIIYLFKKYTDLPNKAHGSLQEEKQNTYQENKKSNLHEN